MKTNATFRPEPLACARALGTLLLATILTLLPGHARAQLYVGFTNDSIVRVYNAATGAVINASLVSGSLNIAPSSLALLQNKLFVTSASGVAVNEYNATTGAVIQNNFIVTNQNTPTGFTISGNNFYLSNPNGGTVGEYDATTGAAITAPLISLAGPGATAISGNNLFVVQSGLNRVGEYNATTGAALNASFISTALTIAGIAVSGNNLYVANGGSQVSEYNATTGALISAHFVTGLNSANGIAVTGNALYVVNAGATFNQGSIGEYDASTGAAINASLVTGLNFPRSIVIAPEPGSAGVVIAFALGAVALLVRAPRRGACAVTSVNEPCKAEGRRMRPCLSGNSPALQCWVPCRGKEPSPAGTAEPGGARKPAEGSPKGTRGGAWQPSFRPCGTIPTKPNMPMKKPTSLTLISAICAMFLSACAGGPTYRSSQASFVPKPGKGLVLAYWTPGFAGAAAQYNVYANDKEIAHGMSRGSFVAYDADPGSLVLATRRKMNATSAIATTIIALPTAGLSLAALAVDATVKHKNPDLTVVAGETYYMRFNGKMKPVPKERGEKEIAGCHLVPASGN